MGKPSAPTPPDPQETAAAQTGTNVSTAVANTILGNMNQTTPNGSLRFKQRGTYSFDDPASGETFTLPQFEAIQTQNARQRAATKNQQAADVYLSEAGKNQARFLNDYLDKPFNPSNIPPQASTAGMAGATGGINDGAALAAQAGQGIQSGYGDPGGYAEQRGRVEEALMARMNPRLDESRQRLRSELINSGYRDGSEQYEQAMREAGQQENDAQMQAILAGGQEQSRLAALDQAEAAFGNQAQGQGFGQLLAAAGFGNQAQNQAFGQQQALFGADSQLRGQSFNEAITERNQPINEITALLSGSQVASPQYAQTSAAPIPTTDYAGLVQNNYAQEMGQYNQELAGRQQLLGGLFGLGGKLGGAAIRGSDRRIKDDIHDMGMKVNGHKLYAFRYKGEAAVHLGFMAQEVQETNPDAVQTMPNGFLGVDYGKALGLAEA